MADLAKLRRDVAFWRDEHKVAHKALQNASGDGWTRAMKRLTKASENFTKAEKLLSAATANR